MASTELQVRQDIKKKNFAPIYLFYGAESFIIEKLTNDIIAGVLPPGSEDFNLDVLYGNEVEAAQIVNIAMSFPMMAEKRMVVVKNVQQVKANGMDLLVNYSKKPSPSTCLVLISPTLDNAKIKQLSKNCETVEFKPLYDYKIPEWIEGYVKEKNLTITGEASRLLHASAGNGLQNISMEIEKIQINLGTRKNIEVQDVEQVVGVSKQFNVFELCDSVGFRKPESSLQILKQLLLLGESPGLIITMLNKHFARLCIVKEMKMQNKNEMEIARVLKVHNFFVKGLAAQASKHNYEQLKKAFALLLETDEQLKTSGQKPKTLLELLLLKMNYM